MNDPDDLTSADEDIYVTKLDKLTVGVWYRAIVQNYNPSVVMPQNAPSFPTNG